MKKCWKWILAAVAILLAGLLIWFIFFHEWTPDPSQNPIPPELSQSQVDMINAEFEAKYSFYKDSKILWDRNAAGTKDFACQFVGVYGDCVAFLQYLPNQDAIFQPIPLPCCIEYEFFEREVYCHNNARIMLYNLKERAFRAAGHEAVRDEKWLTDEQKEQLAQDIEELAKGRVKCPDGHIVDLRWDGVCADCQKETKQPVPQGVKDEMKSANPSIIWYDENGGVEEEFVWRYIGKYGNNYAFLKIRGPAAEPYPLKGVYGDVYYPHNALVVLYNDEKESPLNFGTVRHWASLADARKSGDWITDYQWKRLSQDIEKIAKEHE